MEEIKYKISGDVSLSVPIGDADMLIDDCDGNCALLYLYTLRSGGAFSVREAAKRLKRTDREIENAAARLGELGLLSPVADSGGEKAPAEDSRKEGESAPPPAPERARRLPLPDEIPSYSSQDIVRRSDEDPAFRAVAGEMQRIMGRILTSPELNTLFGIYDYYGLPAEVILLMINHCNEGFRKKYGGEKLPTMRYYEKEARHWADSEIITLQAAEEYLKRLSVMEDGAAKIKKALQISGRELTKTERKYVDSWIEMGFLPDAVAIAYDRTVVQTGSMQWKYMNSILKSWHEKGLKTPRDIENGDKPLNKKAGGKPPARSVAASSGQGSNAGVNMSELERMKKMAEKLQVDGRQGNGS